MSWQAATVATVAAVVVAVIILSHVTATDSLLLQL